MLIILVIFTLLLFFAHAKTILYVYSFESDICRPLRLTHLFAPLSTKHLQIILLNLSGWKRAIYLIKFHSSKAYENVQCHKAAL